MIQTGTFSTFGFRPTVTNFQDVFVFTFPSHRTLTKNRHCKYRTCLTSTFRTSLVSGTTILLRTLLQLRASVAKRLSQSTIPHCRQSPCSPSKCMLSEGWPSWSPSLLQQSHTGY